MCGEDREPKCFELDGYYWELLKKLAEEKGKTPQEFANELLVFLLKNVEKLKRLYRKLKRLRKKYPDIFAEEAKIKRKIKDIEKRQFGR